MEPLRTLFNADENTSVFPEELKRFYGDTTISLPETSEERPYILTNVVKSIDGYTSADEPGHMSGGEISGFNPQDAGVMGSLRALSDAIIVGATTLREEPTHIWTPEFISKELAPQYVELRKRLQKKKNPAVIFVTGSGNLLPPDPNVQTPAVFLVPDMEIFVITTEFGEKVLRDALALRKIQNVEILMFGSGKEVDLKAAMRTLRQKGIKTLLVESGETFNASMALEHDLTDEFFETISDTYIGSPKEKRRPGSFAGYARHPGDFVKTELVSVKKHGNYLFIRRKRVR